MANKQYRFIEIKISKVDDWIKEKSKEKGFKPISISYSDFGCILILYEEASNNTSSKEKEAGK